MRTAPLALLAVTLASCDLVSDPKWVGTYTTEQTWDLGGPLANGRTVGDAVADLLVEELVAVLGIPSLVEDKAEELLDGAVRPVVKAVVDPNAPPEISPGGFIYQVVGASLAKVKVTSDLTLGKGTLPGSLSGAETFNTFSFDYETKTYEFDAKELSKLGVVVTAEWSGKGKDGDVLDVDQHAVEIEFGQLVQKIADLAVTAVDQNLLKGEVKAAVSCDAIVAKLSPDGKGLTIAVSDWSETLDDAKLKEACEKAVPMIEERVLGLFKKDSTIEIGGTASYVAASEEVRSGSDFGGLIAICPKPVAPRLGVVLTAKRLAVTK